MKRLFDFTSAFLGLLALSPVIIVVALLIRFKLGSPILFTQDRPGLNGRVFKMMKFRSMLDAKDKQGNLLPDEQRMTKFGAFLRSTSLDELPGLFNVLKGDMSLVGPRPLLVQYLPLYSEEQARRHNVRPGITGWAQVNGRNAISWEDKFKLDVWYVDNQSFWLDIKILLLTVKKVFLREGISSDGHATTEAFLGCKQNARLYILGAGGFAREVYSYLAQTNFTYNGVELYGFLDDKIDALAEFDLAHEVVGELKSENLSDSDVLILAIANPEVKEQVFDFYDQNKGSIISYIHPSSIVGYNAVIEQGCVSAPYSVIATNVVLGRGCTINAFSSIGHDAKLGKFCTLSGHCDVTGNTTLGDKVFLGSHSTVIPSVKIGNCAVVGAGSVVIRKVNENTTVFGNPAKKIF